MRKLSAFSGLIGALLVTGWVVARGTTSRETLRPLTSSDLPAADVLASLADDERKRELVLDCTGCHQMDRGRVFPDGHARSEASWQLIVQRMLSFAGATTGFPVIGSGRDPVATAAWFANTWTDASAVEPHRLLAPASIDSATIREYLLDVSTDLPHDIAIDSSGRVVVTGMMTHQMHVLDTATGRWASIAIPSERANPRAIEVDGAGRWWVILGRPGQVARYTPDGPAKGWSLFDAGMYAHSVAVAGDGGIWLNGHFTHDPELIAQVDTNGTAVTMVTLPAHPLLAEDPGGPIPYEIRAAPDGTIWMSELRGNRLIGFRPSDRTTQIINLPRAHMGPRRFDIDRRGVLWVPAYAANTLLRIEPSVSGEPQIREFPMPVSNVLPYVARMAPDDSTLWIGTGAGGGVFRFNVVSEQYTYIPLPSEGAVIRHLTFDPHSSDVWLAYGASPGIPARVARLRPR